MKLELSAYKGLKICVAVSGGRDSMALLHCVYSNARKFGITFYAMNCDHRMRENSFEDSAFVKEWCKDKDIPLLTYVYDGSGLNSENEAREWRRGCYFRAIKGIDDSGLKISGGADAIATAHHMDDNAETVLFNLARGSSLSGLTGISDCTVKGANGNVVKFIRPLVGCSRAEIDDYIKGNHVPYVDDETNFKEDYTRNRIRLNVLPQLEKAVHGTSEAIYRFSRLALQDEEFIREEVLRRGVFKAENEVVFLNFCQTYPLFSRAAIMVVKDYFGKKDYTLSHIDSLYRLQNCETGKKFEFLGLQAFKEQSRISISAKIEHIAAPIKFYDFKNGNFGQAGLVICRNKNELPEEYKSLRFDWGKIPEDAVIRTKQNGDKFTKFGGGAKSLGDYLTDRKIPVRLRDKLPLIACGNEILAVCGVEISDKIKITDKTEDVGYIYCDILKDDK